VGFLHLNSKRKRDNKGDTAQGEEGGPCAACGEDFQGSGSRKGMSCRAKKCTTVGAGAGFKVQTLLLSEESTDRWNKNCQGELSLRLGGEKKRLRWWGTTEVVFNADSSGQKGLASARS